MNWILILGTPPVQQILLKEWRIGNPETKTVKANMNAKNTKILIQPADRFHITTPGMIALKETSAKNRAELVK